ncbi:hypothetical protein TB2_029345 [Malus domestica]
MSPTSPPLSAVSRSIIRNALLAIGFLSDNVIRFKLSNYTLRSREEAFKNARALGYFTSAQAIANYGAIFMHVKKQLRAKDSAMIVIGGSYGGSEWLQPSDPSLLDNRILVGV